VDWNFWNGEPREIVPPLGICHSDKKLTNIRANCQCRICSGQKSLEHCVCREGAGAGAPWVILAVQGACLSQVLYPTRWVPWRWVVLGLSRDLGDHRSQLKFNLFVLDCQLSPGILWRNVGWDSKEILSLFCPHGYPATEAVSWPNWAPFFLPCPSWYWECELTLCWLGKYSPTWAMPSVLSSFVFFLFGGTGIWTLSLTCARQALYHMNHSASPFWLQIFQNKASGNICPAWLQTLILLISAT
jgi:hypothetical protein